MKDVMQIHLVKKGMIGAWVLLYYNYNWFAIITKYKGKNHKHQMETNRDN